MAGKERGPLTEPMFYVLMSFLRRDMCGTEITEFVERRTRGRVRLGPGTLYTLLAKFQDEGFIQETEVDGRKRTYRLTDAGVKKGSLITITGDLELETFTRNDGSEGWRAKVTLYDWRYAHTSKPKNTPQNTPESDASGFSGADDCGEEGLPFGA